MTCRLTDQSTLLSLNCLEVLTILKSNVQCSPEMQSVWHKDTSNVHQALCFTHRVPAQSAAPHAPARNYFWWYGVLAS